MFILRRFSIITLILLILSITVTAQQGNNWYFGHQAGITFNTNPPSALTNGILFSDEACAAISDKLGNLLFYTDGVDVYNRAHVIMPNGTGLFGSTSSTSVLILQAPGTLHKFLIFTAGAIESPITHGYRYSEVDMNSDGGNGSVTANKNIPINSALGTERMAATRHANEMDNWLITKEYGNNRFNTYKITCNGIAINPVVSDAGVVHADPSRLSIQGQMKISPDGKKIAVAIAPFHIVQLFDFDNSTGIISNPITISGFFQNSVSVYGVEFSPNSNVLYITDRNIKAINQYDLTSNNEAIINSSRNIITSPFKSIGLQLGPDNKLYVANHNHSHIGVINNPNLYGSGYNYVPAAINLNSGTCKFGFPTFISSYLNPQQWVANFNVNFIDCFIQFQGTSSLPGQLQWNWDFGDGQSGTGQNLQHSYRQPGQYDVQLKVYSLNSCGILFDSIVTTQRVSINNVFNVNFGYTGSCVDSLLQFNDSTILTVGSITGYDWDFGDGMYSNLQNPLHSYSSPGAYNVKLVVSTSGVCRADSIIKTVYVDSKPIASFNSTNGCINLPIHFNDQSSIVSGVIDKWSWEFGGTGSSNNLSPSHIFSHPGEYNVKLTVSSEHGCKDDTLQRINIEAKPVADFTTSVICINQPSNFIDLSTITSGAITDWQWTFGDGSNSIIQNPTHNYILEGDFPVTLKVISRNGCISEPKQLTAVVRKVNANAGRDSLVIYGEPYQLQGSGGISYLWTPPGLLNNASISNPVAILTDDQVFTMKTITAQGCMGSDDVKLSVVKSFDIFVPSGFTPNNDGRNDILRPYPVGIKHLYYFRIYNRGGQVVFATDQIGKGWNGRINGIEQDSGVYIWTVKSMDINGRIFEKKGTSMLIR